MRSKSTTDTGLLILSGFAAGLALAGGLIFWRSRIPRNALPQGFPEPTPTGEIQLQSYPAWRGAGYRVEGDYEQAPNRAFDHLLGHLRHEHLSMTAPVLIDYTRPNADQGEADVFFVYKQPSLGHTGPAPDGIAVIDAPAVEVVSLGLKGPYNLFSLHLGIQQLETWLSAHPEYEAIGPARRLCYHGPDCLPNLRRSDVQIPVRLRLRAKV